MLEDNKVPLSIIIFFIIIQLLVFFIKSNEQKITGNYYDNYPGDYKKIQYIKISDNLNSILIDEKSDIDLLQRELYTLSHYGKYNLKNANVNLIIDVYFEKSTWKFKIEKQLNKAIYNIYIYNDRKGSFIFLTYEKDKGNLFDEYYRSLYKLRNSSFSHM